MDRWLIGWTDDGWIKRWTDGVPVLYFPYFLRYRETENEVSLFKTCLAYLGSLLNVSQHYNIVI